MSHHMRPTTIRSTAITMLVVLALAVAGSAYAGATPIDDKRAQAKAIQDQIDANGEKIGTLGEAYNGAQYRLEQAQQAAAAAQAKITTTRQDIKRLRGVIRKRAVSVYRRAVSGQSTESFDTTDASHLASRQKYAAAGAHRDDQLLADLNQARHQLAQQQQAAEQAGVAAAAERTQIDGSRRQLEAANAEQQRLLSQVQGELAQLVREEQARRATAEAARARARFSPRSGTGNGNPEAFPNVPAPSARAATAIAFARAQLGKPYEYAAIGPETFDCSGLTMAAWGAAGLHLPHYSGAQYDALPHVPLDQMQPGDLVFWGPGGSHHVGIYVGDGLMIHAPHTGDVVKVAAVYGNPVGAARPT
jgi:cell wall-associated NlpC family hydrolase